MDNRMSVVLLLLAFYFQNSQCADSCGRSLQKPLQQRIVAGSDSGYYKYPWFGVLKANGNLRCGCTMINDQYAITAASCFSSYIPVKQDQDLTSAFTVTLGIYNRCNKNETTRKTFRVETVYIHDDFLQGVTWNNIALLKLAEPTGSEPICLPSKPVAAENRPSEAIIVGLGMINSNPVVRTCTVHEGRVLIYNDQDCAKALKGMGQNESLTNMGFCAGGAQETKPFGCGIDLGGPLSAQDSTGSWYILGIISFKKCPDNDNVTLYKDVSKYLDWIHSVIDPKKPTQSTPTTQEPTEPDDYDYEIGEGPNTTTGAPTTTSAAPSSPPPSSIIVGVKSSKHGTHKRESDKKKQRNYETFARTIKKRTGEQNKKCH